MFKSTHQNDYWLALLTADLQQTLNGISQISFSVEENVTPKKPTSLPEVAKQRELSGTLEAESDTKVKKPLSNAKCKELSGNDIFGPPPENPPRSLAAARSLESKEKDMGEPAPRAVRTSVKVSNVSRSGWSILFHSSNSLELNPSYPYCVCQLLVDRALPSACYIWIKDCDYRVLGLLVKVKNLRRGYEGGTFNYE